MTTRRMIEVLIPAAEFTAWRDRAAGNRQSMRSLVRSWLAPHLRRAVTGRSLNVPAVHGVRWTNCRRVRIELTPEQYRAVRLCAARQRTSRNRLLYACLRPWLLRLIGKPAGARRA